MLLILRMLAFALLVHINGIAAAEEFLAEPVGREEMTANRGLSDQAAAWEKMKSSSSVTPMRLSLKSPPGESVAIKLPDLSVVRFQRSRVETTPGGILAWHSENPPSTDGGTIYWREGWMNGTLRIRGMTYMLTSSSPTHGVLVIYEREPSSHSPGGPTLVPADKEPRSEPPRPTSGVIPTIDVAIYYTTASRPYVSDIKTQSELRIAEVNQIFSNSQVGVFAKVVGSFEVPIAESGDSYTDLSAFQNNQFVRQQNSLLGADAAVLVTARSNDCGRSFQSPYGPTPANYAYSVIRADCFLNFWTSAHELGHLLGADHDDKSWRASSVRYAQAYFEIPAYKQTTPCFHTVMSQPDVHACYSYGDFPQKTVWTQKIPYFSNPSVFTNYSSHPIGVSSMIDNSRVMINNAWALAANRSPQLPMMVNVITSLLSDYIETSNSTH